MKIHVVQKGETLWKIAQKYGVDFQELKKMNTQLSNPDMIMPGMKIKVPSTSKQVKKEQPIDKEMKKYPANQVKKEEPKTTHPYKDTTEKAMPVIKEDDKKKPSPVKKEIPMEPVELPKVPMMEQHMEKYPTNINLPKAPHIEQTKYDVDVDFDVNQTDIDVNQTDIDLNDYHTNPYPTQPIQQPVQYQPIQQPVMNYYQPMPHCMSASGIPYGYPQMNPVQTQPNYYSPYAQPQVQPNTSVDANNYTAQSYHPTTYPSMQGYEDLMESSSSSMEMPQMPSYLAGVPQQEEQNVNYPMYGQGYMPVPGVNQQGYGYPQVTNQMPGYPQGFNPQQINQLPVGHNPYGYPQQPGFTGGQGYPYAQPGYTMPSYGPEYGYRNDQGKTNE
ncbi:SafA/ExsA family spore coat assembly protein [Aquibacillus kalidii]|nr:SafA/ExsA family spore coat assembly protein [Aquibacillus kalidii]